MCKKSGNGKERSFSQARYFSAVLLCVTQRKILPHEENRSFIITGFLNKDGVKKENHRFAKPVVFCKTPFPGYSRGGALRAKIKLIQCKPAGIPLEQVVFCLIALRAYPERLAYIQGEHLHKVFSVYPMLMVGHHDRKSTARGNTDKVLHILC